VIATLVLTAGVGTRLDPITRLVAKPAVPLGGATLIERVLRWLEREGVRDVVLNLHHRPETIAAIVGDGAHLGLRVRYSWEQPRILGSAGGPRHALPLLAGTPLFVINGDTLCETPLAPMIAAHRASGAAVTMALVPNPAPDHYNGVALDVDDRVRGFVPKGPAARGTWHFIGIQVAERALFAPLADGVAAETVAGLYRDLVAKDAGLVRGWRVSEPWIDVGTPRDYLEAALALSPGAASSVAAGASVAASARLTSSLVWPGATVLDDAVLDGCIVAGEVTVPRGYRARDSVLVPAAVARSGDRADVSNGIARFDLGR
jgi:mannose-1-phosphate guanylyltransferase